MDKLICMNSKIRGLAISHKSTILRQRGYPAFLRFKMNKFRKLIKAIIAGFWTLLRWDMYPCDGAVGKNPKD